LTESSQFDFIVVGAGSAGCAVAGRLGEAGHSVLLLEAGGADKSPWIHIPLGYAKLYSNPKVNWCYTSEPEPYLNNRRLFQPRGKVMGGTGSINGMIYMRGQAADFDSWAKDGCEGWSWDDVLPYFKKCEDQQRGADEYHGEGGPVAVSDLPSKHELGEAFHQASHALGSPYNDDFNGAHQLGTGYVQTTTKNGKRWSTARGYLQGEALKNIQIEKHALVQRIDIENKRAVGVTWTGPSGIKKAFVKAEVIVCAGVYNSPQLLELSGIGSARLLKDRSVELVHDLPGVGENLRDHFGIGLEFRSLKKSTVNDIYNNPFKGGAALLRYFISRTGPFADNGNYSNTFIRTSPNIKTPDMMVTFMAWCTDENLKPRPFSGFTILAEHIRPDARGSVHVNSGNPSDAPAIRFNFLKSKADQKAALAGLRFGRDISQTSPMRECVESELSPGLNVHSDEELLDYTRENGLSLLHGVGTCKMGSDETAVVDHRLRVRGIEGLRVVDASIMPTIVSGNTNAAAIMIGEKGAAMVLEDCRLNSHERSV
jgi:choline dehydrogenase